MKNSLWFVVYSLWLRPFHIAEGFDRGGTKELSNFLSIAKGSVGEVEAQLYVALDQNYISHDQFKNLYAMTSSTKKLIAGFMICLNQTSIKGIKYKNTEV